MLQLRTAEEEISRSEISLLRQAVLQNDARLLDEMLCQEVYKKVINCRGGWGVSGTPLHAAVSKGHLSCLQVLLGRGALVDCVDVKAQTPLFSAVRGKYLDCVLALLKAGANPNGNSSNNCSPVLTAAREGDVKILKELLDGGAEGSIKQPKTVLEMCLRHGCGVEFVQLLIDFGANVYLPTLIIEKSTKQNEAVELLLEERGNPKALSSQCRLAVRAHLKTMDRMHLIDQLDMPTRLVNFLKHKPVSVPVL
ncbi:hypothetical protein CesoFtcFv8_021676 [Champsocephalus esox]|uniref:SOCS box domain-containing protein n=1 Tax=Champsocephalus esox TaxID=159716 RepID=A0AAN8GIZ2_9TELE|nr:hypothetical protein CesoFtcFv8_021676 [Champsocephalus esox]